MKQITVLGKEAKQKFQFLISEGEIDFQFNYVQNQLAWFISFKFKDKEFNNIKLALNKNILRGYKNYLPFGIMVRSNSKIEPMFIDDFVNNRTNVYVLNKEEVRQIENYYNE